MALPGVNSVIVPLPSVVVVVVVVSETCAHANGAAAANAMLSSTFFMFSLLVPSTRANTPRLCRSRDWRAAPITYSGALPTAAVFRLNRNRHSMYHFGE